MPFSTNPLTNAYNPSEPLPQHLAHKPVYALPYEIFDHAIYNPTDIRYMTIGLSQWDQDDISVKTMRHTGTKWTRQAEELPIHRAIDLVTFTAKTLFDENKGVVEFPSGTFHQQASDLTLSRELRAYGEMASYDNQLSVKSQFLKARLDALLITLQDLRRRGKI